MNEVESLVIKNLMLDEEYVRKALPFIKSEFFTNHNESTLFGEINEFVNKYKNLPTKETILIELNRRKDINDDELKLIKELILHNLLSNSFKYLFISTSGIDSPP